jgi:cytochrome d ubiquinol oxidase subunit I
MGRQPWIVYGLLRTVQAESPTVSVADVAFTLGGFVLLYTVLGAIDVILMYLSARHGLGEDPHPPDGPAAPGEAPAEELIY